MVTLARPLPASGGARLVQFLDTRLELLGGTDADRQAAMQWMATYLPEARLGQRKPLLWSRKPRASG